MLARIILTRAASGVELDIRAHGSGADPADVRPTGFVHPSRHLRRDDLVDWCRRHPGLDWAGAAFVRNTLGVHCDGASRSGDDLDPAAHKCRGWTDEDETVVGHLSNGRGVDRIFRTPVSPANGRGLNEAEYDGADQQKRRRGCDGLQT